MTTYVYRIHGFCCKYEIANSTFYREVQLGRLRTIRCKGKQFITEQEAERWHNQRKTHRVSDLSAKRKPHHGFSTQPIRYADSLNIFLASSPKP